MTIIKPLNPPRQLQILHALSVRKEISHDDKQYLHLLLKGYEGEKRWQNYLNDLPSETPILFDLTLTVNHTLFQVDALIIQHHHITFFEIKNYSGNITIHKGQWYHSSDKEIKNPLIQIERNETLIRQFLKQHGLQVTFDYLLIFVHPEFMLYDHIPRVMDINIKDPLEIFVDTDKIILRKYSNARACMITGEISSSNVELADGKIVLSTDGLSLLKRELEKYTVLK